ncbi:unnamed protein product [Amoebophrya sp. A120]|nr:unnamed protein product [Amoebophrya sp. A120]|eukprot:GSA120T00020706001.1
MATRKNVNGLLVSVSAAVAPPQAPGENPRYSRTGCDHQQRLSCSLEELQKSTKKRTRLTFFPCSKKLQLLASAVLFFISGHDENIYRGTNALYSFTNGLLLPKVQQRRHRQRKVSRTVTATDVPSTAPASSTTATDVPSTTPASIAEIAGEDKKGRAATSFTSQTSGEDQDSLPRKRNQNLLLQREMKKERQAGETTESAGANIKHEDLLRSVETIGSVLLESGSTGGNKRSSPTTFPTSKNTSGRKEQKQKKKKKKKKTTYYPSKNKSLLELMKTRKEHCSGGGGGTQYTFGAAPQAYTAMPGATILGVSSPDAAGLVGARAGAVFGGGTNPDQSLSAGTASSSTTSSTSSTSTTREPWVPDRCQGVQANPGKTVPPERYVDYNGQKVKGVFMVIADWGWTPGAKSDTGCQMAIGREALNYLNDKGMTHLLKFVLAAGDNIYGGAVDGSLQDIWLNRYDKELTCVPWYAVLGNHDFGHTGEKRCWPYPEEANCGQINGDYETVRTSKQCIPKREWSGSRDCWAMPKASYSVTAWEEELNLTLIGTDGNDLWHYGYPFGSWGRGATQGPLGRLKEEGLAELRDRLGQKTAQNIVVFNHYPWDYAGDSRQWYENDLNGAVRDQGKTVFFFAGHTHTTQGPKDFDPKNDVQHYISGGAGGYCTDECGGGWGGVNFGLVKEDGTIEVVKAPEGKQIDECRKFR